MKRRKVSLGAPLRVQVLPEWVAEYVARQLPVHPRSFALAARSGRWLRGAVEVVRGELGQRACAEHGLQSTRGEEAGQLLVELTGRGETRSVLRLVVARAPLDSQDQDFDGLT
mgnify:CR=1 FL=1